MSFVKLTYLIHTSTYCRSAINFGLLIVDKLTIDTFKDSLVQVYLQQLTIISISVLKAFMILRILSINIIMILSKLFIMHLNVLSAYYLIYYVFYIKIYTLE